MRRSRLLTLGIALMVLLAACGTAVPEPAQPEPTATTQSAEPDAEPTEEPAVSAYSEAPMLAELVEAGELPAVDERLPANPYVLEPVEEIGVYGGAWRAGLRGGGDSGLFWRTFYDNLFFWQDDGDVVPNIAEKYEANDDFSEYTIYLRRGLKWSDGAPYTADDIMFVYEDIWMNEELNPGGPPGWLTVIDDPAVFEKIDDFTVKVTFDGPNGFFIKNVARGSGHPLVQHPKHYAQQFHIKYNPDGIDALMEEYGAETWVDLWNQMGSTGSVYTDVARPTVFPWRLVEPYTGEATRVVFERNAYYGKVDSAGNQLPYLDRLEFTRYEDVEVLTLAALNGEIDMQARHIGDVANRALFLENAEAGGFHLTNYNSGGSSDYCFNFNFNHQDAETQALFQNLDFRVGLSYALDREEINDIVYFGGAPAYQAAPRPESPFYHERLATQYTEFDLDLAAEHLEAAGLTRDSDDNWLRPNGERLSFTVLAEQAAFDGSLELAMEQWQSFGIDAQWTQADRSLIDERTAAADFDVLAYWGVGGLDAILEPAQYLPIAGDSRYAGAWVEWYSSGGEGGEEPPEIVKQQYDLWRQLQATGDADEQSQLMEQILDIAADQFYCVGMNLRPMEFAVTTDIFRNVPEMLDGSWPGIARSYPAQFFKTEQ